MIQNLQTFCFTVKLTASNIHAEHPIYVWAWNMDNNAIQKAFTSTNKISIIVQTNVHTGMCVKLVWFGLSVHVKHNCAKQWRNWNCDLTPGSGKL
jgi:hypothetical protein